MKMKMRPRYYCDHCGKGSGSPSSMRRHERGCTNNRDRICGMCGAVGVAPALISALGEGDDAGVSQLRAVANQCPACMLAAIRQSGKAQGGDEEGWFRVPFDFAAEKECWWKARNAEEVAGR